MARRRSILLAGIVTEPLVDAIRSLQNEGYAVVSSHNRNETIVLVSERYFDLVLLAGTFGENLSSLASDLSTVCPDVPVLVLQPSSQFGDSILERVRRTLGRRRKRPTDVA